MQILENELMKNHSKISCHQFHTVIYWFWYLICAITTNLLHIFWARWDETMICLAHHLQLLIWKIIYNCPRTIFGLKKSQKSLMHISSSISLWLSIEYPLRTWHCQNHRRRFAYIQLFGEYVRVEAQMPLGDVHTAMVQETPLQSTGVTLVNNLQA